MKDYSKLIGYILFVVTLIGRGVTIGVYKTQLEGMKTDMAELHEMMLDQQQLNGKILMYIEMDAKE